MAAAARPRKHRDENSSRLVAGDLGERATDTNRPTKVPNCRQEVAVIGRYLDASLEAPVARAFELHLKACPYCTAFLATYRKTVEMTAAFLQLQSMKPGWQRLTFKPAAGFVTLQ
jgi:hypothetical protein